MRQVINALRGSISELSHNLNAFQTDQLRAIINDQRFFLLANLHEAIEEDTSKRELCRFVEKITSMPLTPRHPPSPPKQDWPLENEGKSHEAARDDRTKPLSPHRVSDKAEPTYSRANLDTEVTSAFTNFHRIWQRRLAPQSMGGEHWARIKALSRRLAIFDEHGYDNLRPVAELRRELQTNLSRFLSEPVARASPGEKDRLAQTTNALIREVSRQLPGLVADHLARQQQSGWLEAYRFEAQGSAAKRSEKIKRIFEEVAPRSTRPSRSRSLRADIIAVVNSALEQHRGRLK